MAEKVEILNNKQSPIADIEIEDFLQNKELSLTAALDQKLTFSGCLSLSMKSDPNNSRAPTI